MISRLERYGGMNAISIHRIAKVNPYIHSNNPKIRQLIDRIDESIDRFSDSIYYKNQDAFSDLEPIAWGEAKYDRLGKSDLANFSEFTMAVNNSHPKIHEVSKAFRKALRKFDSKHKLGLMDKLKKDIYDLEREVKKDIKEELAPRPKTISDY